MGYNLCIVSCSIISFNFFPEVLMGFIKYQWILMGYHRYTYVITIFSIHRRKIHICKWRFPEMGLPQHGWFFMQNPTKMDDFWGTPIFRNHHTCSSSSIISFIFCPEVWIILRGCIIPPIYLGYHLVIYRQPSRDTIIFFRKNRIINTINHHDVWWFMMIHGSWWFMVHNGVFNRFYWDTCHQQLGCSVMFKKWDVWREYSFTPIYI